MVTVRLLRVSGMLVEVNGSIVEDVGLLLFWLHRSSPEERREFYRRGSEFEETSASVVNFITDIFKIQQGSTTKSLPIPSLFNKRENSRVQILMATWHKLSQVQIVGLTPGKGPQIRE